MAFSTGVKCQGCGASLDGDSIFCTGCGRKVCAGCGALLDNTSSFCTDCGRAIGVDETPVTTVMPMEPMPAGGRTCPVCGVVVEDDAVFCTGCGTPLTGGATPVPIVTPVPTVMPVTPVPTEAPVPTIGRTCPVCGAILEDDDKFCTSCGSKVDGGGATSSGSWPDTPLSSDPGPSGPAGGPVIFEGGEDDTEAEREMKKYFRAPGDVG